LFRHDGTTVYSGRSTAGIGYGDDFLVRSDEGGEVQMYQRIVVPSSVYERLRAQSLRVEIDYSLTLFRVEAENSLSALNGDRNVAAFGRCRTAVDVDEGDVELGCIKTGSVPACVTVALENPGNGKRNPETPYCTPDYAPLRPHFLPDAMSHFGADIKFQDLQQLAKYPVDGSQLGDARVTLRAYEPRAHFTRRLIIPDVHLENWSVGPP
ncbi:MAG TPA: hypothetical protein VGM97_17795, partial [Steroidobacteraceae bacterium]